jgi:hypothetical protein
MAEGGSAGRRAPAPCNREAIYEQDFLPCSYGFRPGRSAHQALQALRTGFMSQGLRWVIDLDTIPGAPSLRVSR